MTAEGSADGGARRPGSSWRRPGGDRGDHGRVPTQRLFVAIPLPDAVRSAIGALVDGVRGEVEGAAGGPGGHAARWVRIDGLHLTLRFLGATTPERRAAVEAAVAAAAATTDPIPVRLGGAGAFPSVTHPRVLWLGVRDGADGLAALADDLERRLVEAGWPPEGRPFQAHLTLARCDGARLGPRTAAALVEAARALDLGWSADRVTLFLSHLGGGPARYEALVEVPLGGHQAPG